MIDVTEFNADGSKIERDFTKEELAQRKKDAESVKEKLDAEAEKTTARLVLLNRLGLTEDEIKLLLGGN